MSRKGYFLLMMISMFFVANAQKTSNKPVVKSTTKPTPFIMHMVKFGETLTKISKMYDVTISEILKANPSLTEDNLKPEQIIRVPNKGNKLVESTTKTNNTAEPKVSTTPTAIPKNTKYHIVETGQTMYSISKMYGVKVEDIQKWNNLTDYNVKVGSQLIVSNAVNLKPDTIISKEESKLKSLPTTDKPIVPEKAEPKQTPAIQEETETQKPDIQASDNATQKDLAKIFKEKATTMSIQVAKGTGAPMTTSLGVMETVYFAMHKWLPIGTIIKIKNLVNSKIVYAKIIGKLPDNDENKNVIVRYSLGVKKDLQLQNGKCYLQIEYPN